MEHKISQGGQAPDSLPGWWKIPILAGEHKGDSVVACSLLSNPMSRVKIPGKVDLQPIYTGALTAIHSFVFEYRLVRSSWGMSNGTSEYWGYFPVDMDEGIARRVLIEWVLQKFSEWVRAEKDPPTPPQPAKGGEETTPGGAR